MDNFVLNSEELKNESVEQIDDNNEVPKQNVRDTLYGRIDVSVETMDKIITVLLVALVLSIIVGVII